jgi:MoxR-like ATPase
MDFLSRLHPTAGAIVDNVERVLLGKREAIELCLAAMLAHGHVLIEDVPGVGKTVLARALSISIGATFKRIQFTPDLLPGDVTGVQVYNPESRQFEFRPGPVMTQVLLADEINRATPKTQSALLESMDERRVTVDGVAHALPDPFIVLATQNPIEFEGTFPLPESQLDRFIISLRLGYPGRAHELGMLANQEQAHPIEALGAVASVAALAELQEAVRNVYVDESVRHYLLDLVEATRRHTEISLGASPRATLALFRMAQAWALLHDRDFVLPDDVKAVSGPVLRHRLVPAAYLEGGSLDGLIDAVLHRVPVPGNRG